MKRINYKKKNFKKRQNHKRHLRTLKSKSKKRRKETGATNFRQNVISSFIPQTAIRKTEYLNVPVNFSLKVDLENVVRFIQKLKSYTKLNSVFKAIELNLQDLVRIDTAAISLLLSSIKELGIYNINVIGNLPDNIGCQEFMISSGFMEHMNFMNESLKSRIKQSNPHDKNMMIMNGKEHTNHRDIGKIINQSIEKLTGKPSHYKPLYGVIGEMNINSLEHAYKRSKHWVFAVRYDEKNDKINFTFTDNGFGINNTLRKNFSMRTFELLGLKSEVDIVEGMFREEYSSRFKKQFNRNKGLPAIRNLQMEKKVDNLIVLTNNTYIDFEKNIKINLKSSFSGTFYYWELSKKTYEKNQIT